MPFDLTRAPDGRWWVLSDRAQAPGGVGYALENRAIISRFLPDEFRDCQVQRIAGFFTRREAGLRTLAPWSNAPNIVLLTSGPCTGTYFEHAYLARHLGYPLVEGNDLTVRGRRVFLKTLEGLQRVDVIIRRVDDTWCDPLELRADSMLGVPGLVDAARAGNVAISNPLGAGAVESTAILAFLPALARHLLGEKLRIPNVATWWCGQEGERNYALKALRSLVIKPAFAGDHAESSFGEKLSPADLDEVLHQRRGVCQDFAHLAIAGLRSLGLPARYVSGYIETQPPAGRPRLVGADVSHAWLSVWCPDHGWIDADPTNNLLPGDRHVTVAWGRDFSDVSPLHGVVVGGGKHRLRVGVTVSPLEEI